MSTPKEDLSGSESLSTIQRLVALSHCILGTLFVISIFAVQYVGINLEEGLRSKRAGASEIVESRQNRASPFCKARRLFPR